MIQNIIALMTNYLPLWIILSSVIAYIFADLFIGIQELTGFCLGLIFFFMGLSLSTNQIMSIVKNPKYAFVGFTLKWTITIGITLLIALTFFKSSPEIASGVILSGVVPSGTSANLYTFIAGGEVALSITMATLDTIVAPLFTPTIAHYAIGQVIPIEYWALFLNIIWIVFIPLFSGLIIQWKFPRQIVYVKPYTSLVSQVTLLTVVLAVVSKAQPALQQNIAYLPLIFVAVILQVVIPMFIGFAVIRIFNVSRGKVIAIMFHTGICNTALSATLASEHISALAAVPAVANMIVNLTVGAFVARIFIRNNERMEI